MLEFSGVKQIPFAMTPRTQLVGGLSLLDDRHVSYVLSLYAECGQKEIVLTDDLMRKMLEDSRQISRWERLLKDQGMRFVDAHVPFSWEEDLNTLDPATRATMVSHYACMLDICAYFGVDTITAHTGNTHLSHDVDLLHSKLLESLEKILPLAEARKHTICIENIWYPTNTADRLLDAVAHFTTPALGICYDSGHANLTSGKERGENNAAYKAFKDCGLEPEWQPDLLDKVLPHVVNCHLHDNHAVWDEHNSFGDGNVAWNEITPKLLSAPRLRAIQCETSQKNAATLSIREHLRRFHATLDKFDH